MAKKAKKNIYCQKCSNIAVWYKKGKKQRVLVCPKCGIIAHNPIPWSLIGGAVGSIVPGVGTAIGAGVGSIIEGVAESRTEQKAAASTGKKEKAQKTVLRDENKLSRTDLIINQVLGE